MQIHELTTKSNLDEGMWDTVKGELKKGALNTLHSWGIGQGVAGGVPDLQNAIGRGWAEQVTKLIKINGGRPLTQDQYRKALDQFVDKVFFKDEMELLSTQEKAIVQTNIDRVAQVYDKPAQVKVAFDQLVNALAGVKVTDTAGLERWKGKQLQVDLRDQASGMVRRAIFTWDGTNWIDAFSGQPATTKTAKKLTRLALGRV